MGVARLGCALGLLTLASPVGAHDPGLSALSVRVEQERIVAHLSVARDDAKWVHPSLGNSNASGSEAGNGAADLALSEFALAAVEMKVDGRVVAPLEMSPVAGAHHDLEIEIIFPREPGSCLETKSIVFASLPRGHRQFVTVLDERQQLLGQRILDASHPSVSWQLERQAIRPSREFNSVWSISILLAVGFWLLARTIRFFRKSRVAMKDQKNGGLTEFLFRTALLQQKGRKPQE